jgi:hypothetical protein
MELLTARLSLDDPKQAKHRPISLAESGYSTTTGLAQLHIAIRGLGTARTPVRMFGHRRRKQQLAHGSIAGPSGDPGPQAARTCELLLLTLPIKLAQTDTRSASTPLVDQAAIAG